MYWVYKVSNWISMLCVYDLDVVYSRAYPFYTLTEVLNYSINPRIDYVSLYIIALKETGTC